MKAWRLIPERKELELLDIDDETRQVRRVTQLQLKAPMTKEEAITYVKSHFPMEPCR